MVERFTDNRLFEDDSNNDNSNCGNCETPCKNKNNKSEKGNHILTENKGQVLME